MLGDRFIVRNFGVMGHTLQSAGDYPYRISKAFKSSSAFEPDVVLLMLGTNDSKPPNWKGIEPFSADYRELIAHYQSLGSAPEVYPMTPPALFGMGRRNKVRYGMDAAVVEEMGRAIRDIATRMQDSRSSTSTPRRSSTRRLSGSTGCTPARREPPSSRVRCSRRSRGVSDDGESPSASVGTCGGL